VALDPHSHLLNTHRLLAKGSELPCVAFDFVSTLQSDCPFSVESAPFSVRPLTAATLSLRRTAPELLGIEAADEILTENGVPINRTGYARRLR
jgi:hypothetical protein